MTEQKPAEYSGPKRVFSGVQPSGSALWVRIIRV